MDKFIINEQEILKEEQRLEEEEYDMIYKENTIKNLTKAGYILDELILINTQTCFVDKTMYDFKVNISKD